MKRKIKEKQTFHIDFLIFTVISFIVLISLILIRLDVWGKFAILVVYIVLSFQYIYKMFEKEKRFKKIS